MKKLILLCAMFAALASNAGIIYQNDFSIDTGLISNNNDALSLSAADSNFDSQYLTISSKSDGNFTFPFYDGDDANASAVMTFTFDANFSDFTTTSGKATFRLRARGTDGTTDQMRYDIKPGAVETDKTYNYSFVINNSSTAVAIEGQDDTIAANSWAIYEDAELIDSGAAYSTATSDTAIDYLTFWLAGDSNAAEDVSVGIDNFVVRDTAYAAIPEPATLGMLGLGAFGLMALRRRFA